jgi:hypothetical protein
LQASLKSHINEGRLVSSIRKNKKICRVKGEEEKRKRRREGITRRGKKQTSRAWSSRSLLQDDDLIVGFAIMRAERFFRKEKGGK